MCQNLLRINLVVDGYVLLVLPNVDNACVAPQKTDCYFSLPVFYFVFEKHMFLLGISLFFEKNMFNVHRTLFKNHYSTYYIAIAHFPNI